MMSKSRLESFSDGVMAIVITLLAFDLVVPVKQSVDMSEAAVAFSKMLPEFLLFFISFITLATMWINHHFIMSKIEHVTTKMLWVNSILLMFMTLVPFVASFISKNPLNSFSVMLYAFLMFTISFMFSQLYRFANTENDYRHSKRIKHIGMFAYGTSFFLALVSPLLGYIFICIPLLVYVYPRQ